MVAYSREPRNSRAARRLNEPQRALVLSGGVGSVPVSVNRVSVIAVREEWRVVDRWWTADPVRRRYFDVVLETGEHAVVFHDEERGEWFTQRA